jgi:hypothetical protein
LCREKNQAVAPSKRVKLRYVWKPRSPWLLAAGLGFVAGLASCFFAPIIRDMIPPLESIDWAEQERVTSPNEKFDAVLIQEGLDA